MEGEGLGPQAMSQEHRTYHPNPTTKLVKLDNKRQKLWGLIHITTYTIVFIDILIVAALNRIPL